MGVQVPPPAPPLPLWSQDGTNLGCLTGEPAYPNPRDVIDTLVRRGEGFIERFLEDIGIESDALVDAEDIFYFRSYSRFRRVLLFATPSSQFLNFVLELVMLYQPKSSTRSRTPRCGVGFDDSTA